MFYIKFKPSVFVCIWRTLYADNNTVGKIYIPVCKADEPALLDPLFVAHN
jgi:hypothetical protein